MKRFSWLKNFLGAHRDRASVFIALLFFMYPLGMASVNHYASTLYVVFALFGLYRLLVDREPLPRQQLWLASAIIIFLCTVGIGYLNAADTRAASRIFGKMVYFIALPLFYALVHKYYQRVLSAFICGLVFAGPINLLIGLYSVYVQGLARGKGYYHPIIFGDLMMLGGMLLLTLFAAGVFRSRLAIALAGISASCFICASLLSGTRGALLALPFALFVIVFLFRKSLTFKRAGRIFVGVALLAIILLSLSQYSNRGQRVFVLSSIVDNVELYLQGSKLKTSEGQRLFMWGAALDMFAEQPLLGAGLGGFRVETQKQIEAQESALVQAFTHAHNIYFHSLAETGLLGLLALLSALFIIPGVVFFQALRGSQVQRISAASGLVFLTCFAVFGLTESWLSRSPMLISYIVCLAVFTTVCSVDSSGEDSFHAAIGSRVLH